MARLPRFVLVGHPQHVIIRGNNREPIFYADEDYQFCLEKLKKACDKHECDIHAYVLMTNHVHLLITPHKKDGISKVIQMLGRYYVQYFNNTYQRKGTLWEGRYKATLIDSEHYALGCYRYIELNPVRAEMVEHPAEYPWSSYGFNGLGDKISLLSLMEFINVWVKPNRNDVSLIELCLKLLFRKRLLKKLERLLISRGCWEVNILRKRSKIR